MQVVFKSGSPEFVDHTPGSAVSAGDVVVTADTPRIAHRDIAANVLGSLAARGGVYSCTGDAVIAADKKVYWVNASNKVSEDDDSGANKAFGVTTSACSGDGSTCEVRHDPGA
jgi:predicted RecA/RadA family phage recombinase